MESAKGPRRSSGRSRRLRRDIFGGVLRRRGHRETPGWLRPDRPGRRQPRAILRPPPPPEPCPVGVRSDSAQRPTCAAQASQAAGRLRLDGGAKRLACTILFLLQGVHVPVARRRTVSRTTSFYETLYRLLLVWKLQLQSSTLSHCVGSWHEHEHVQATVS